MIQLGDKIRDKVTGVTGIATQRIEMLNGCVQYTIRQPVDKDGKIPEMWSYDEQQLEVVEKNPCGLGKPSSSPVTGGAESRPARSN